MKSLENMTEEELREYDAPWPKSIDELTELIETLSKRGHDYGTCVYAMSISAVATFHYIAHVLGVTGFQAGCADLDILKRTRGMKHGFSILDYNNLLYPQYLHKFDNTAMDYIKNNLSMVQEEAKKLLEEDRGGHGVHSDVQKHWEWLMTLRSSEQSSSLARTQEEEP